MTGSPHSVTSACRPLGLLSLGLFLARTVSAAVTLTVTPSSISNEYAGPITVQVGGLTNTEQVLVEKFLDSNANGVVDAGDLLVQSFRLQDGLASIIGGVTNINVPGDTDAAPGTITARLSSPRGDIAQRVVGPHHIRLSSPSGHFAPLTNSFNVTNSAHGQAFSGQVRSGAAAVPYAGVMLFTPPSGGGDEGMFPVAATVADASGNYTLPAAPGTYMVWAFRSNYVADLSAAPVLTLGVGATITTNLDLLAATRSVSGQLVEAGAPSTTLPAVLVVWQSANGLLAVGFTDSTGTFSVPVTAGQWEFGTDDQSIIAHGYLRSQTSPVVDTSTGNVAGVTIALPKGTALIYGTVKDGQNNPLAGVGLYASDDLGQYEGNGTTDENGNYAIAVTAGGWYLGASSDSPGYENFVFSWGGHTNLSSGQTVPVNLVGVPATNQISGFVRDTSENPIAGVGVYAYATINGTTFDQYRTTDSTGYYSMSVAGGSWHVNVNCGSGNDSLSQLGYQCVPEQLAVISNNNAVVNFTAAPCGPLQITTTLLPDGSISSYYSVQLQANGCQWPFTWSLSPGSASLPPGMSLYADGTLIGVPSASGTFNFSVRVTDASLSTADQPLALTIAGTPLQVTTTFLPNATVGSYYSAQLTASGGQLPYVWSLTPGSANLPANLSLDTNGVLSGTPATNGSFNFFVRVTDANAVFADQFLSLTINNLPVQITTASLPNATIGAAYNAQLAATGGQPPYTWTLAIGSAELPPGLTLDANGLIHGAPLIVGTFNFIVDVRDVFLVATTRPLAIRVYPRPTLTSATRTGDGQFQFVVNGGAGHSYTIQSSSNLTAWTTLRVTNAPADVFTVQLGPATNPAVFYRVLVGL